MTKNLNKFYLKIRKVNLQRKLSLNSLNYQVLTF